MKSTLRLALVLSALCFGALPARADVAPSKDNGACSIGKQSSATGAAPWLLAAAFSSLFLIGRRRRR